MDKRFEDEDAVRASIEGRLGFDENGLPVTEEETLDMIFDIGEEKWLGMKQDEAAFGDYDLTKPGAS